jgi:curved DNA-binding protein CbpA
MMTYYEILGISDNASLNEIEKAYEKVKEYGIPCSGRKLDSMLINEAYLTLVDPYRRGRYDESLSHGESSYDPDFILFDVNDVEKSLGIGRDKAYAIMALPDFPSITIGSRRVVTKRRYLIWLDKKAFTRIKL